MVGILLKIGKQSENVGEEEVFGRFCIRDVTENPSGGLLRRADIRRISAGYPPGIRRISALRKTGFGGWEKAKNFRSAKTAARRGPKPVKKGPKMR